jgi:hypothetical protein
MADYYCDHGAYGLTTNRLGLDAPVTWGVPQEGDGSSKDAATASSTGSILFGSVPTSGTISVCGASVSTTNVIGAASADAAANALATNINATTNTVSTTFANATTTNANRLQNVVYARGPSGGAPAGTCQIMSRIGSASHNTTAIATTFDGSPTLTQFTGGSGGCWGWFMNDVALGASSAIAQYGYGLFNQIPLVGATPTLTDTVWVRTGGGASKTITRNWSSNINVSHAAFEKNLVFDTNTKWTGDSATGTLKIVFYGTGWNTTCRVYMTNPGRYNSYTALRRGGFEIEHTVSTTQIILKICSAYNSNGGASGYKINNVVLRDSANQTSSFIANELDAASGSNSANVVWENSDWLITTARSTVYTAPLMLGGYAMQNGTTFQALGCKFDLNISGVSDPGVLISNNNYLYPYNILLQGCEFKGYVSGYTLLNNFNNWVSSPAVVNIVVDNCSGIAMPSTYIGIPYTSGVLYSQGVHQLTYSNTTASSQNGLRIEDSRGVAEWVPNDPTPFPYLSATLPVSGDGYSMRLLWIRAVPLKPGAQYESPDFRMIHQLSAATRTLALNVFMPDVVTENIKVGFSYIDSSGVARREETSVIAASSASWTNAGSYSGYSAKKFEVTTDYAIKAESEIVATVTLFGVPGGSDAIVPVYVDPEFTVI